MRLPVNERSRSSYLSAYRTHVEPVYGSSTLARVANDRDGVLDLLTVTMKELGISVRRNARMVITGTCDEAVVKAGKIREHQLADIELADNGTKHDRTDLRVYQQAGEGGDSAGFHAAFSAACVRVGDAEQGSPDHRRGAPARAPGRAGDIPDLRPPRAVRSGPRYRGSGRAPGTRGALTS